MIRINLLPVRAAKKKETAKQQISIFMLSFFGVLVVFAAVYFLLLARISGTKEEISRSEQEIQQLKAKIGEIENLKKLKEDVQKKLDVLNRLRKEKTGPAHRLMTLCDVTPEKLWLNKYTENGSDVSISGYAYSEDIIAMFMRSLESSEDFANVELLVSEQSEMNGIKVKRFDISCKFKSAKKEEPKERKEPQKK